MSWPAAVSATADKLDTGISGIRLFVDAIPFNFYSLLTLVFIVAEVFIDVLIPFYTADLVNDIKAGDITFFRLQTTPDTKLQAYIAQGEILPVPTRSFGGIGVFAIPEMARFYRHVLISKHYPHHGAVAFGHVGKALYTIFQYLNIADIAYNQPRGTLYADENPFA